MLVVEQLQPVGRVVGDCRGQPTGHLDTLVMKTLSLWEMSGYLEPGIQQPDPHGDGQPSVHHVEEHHQGVRLGVGEAPHYVGQGLAEGELLGWRNGVAVDTSSLGNKLLIFKFLG